MFSFTHMHYSTTLLGTYPPKKGETSKLSQTDGGEEGSARLKFTSAAPRSRVDNARNALTPTKGQQQCHDIAPFGMRAARLRRDIHTCTAGSVTTASDQRASYSPCHNILMQVQQVGNNSRVSNLCNKHWYQWSANKQTGC